MFDQLVGFFEGEDTPVCTTEQAAGVALWVNAVHDCAPITEVEADWKRHLKFPDGDSSVVIQNMEYYAWRAFQEGKSFLALEAPWAVASQKLDLSDYREFQARQFPDPKPQIP